MRTAWLIAVKDLRQRFRDRSAILIAVVAPLGLAFIFSRLIGSSAVFHAGFVVVDLDHGTLAGVFRTDVVGPLEKQGIVDVIDLPTEAAAQAAVEDGRSAAIIIPQGFTAAIQAGERTTLRIIGARPSRLGTLVAEALAKRFGDGVATVQLSVATVETLRGAPLDPAAHAAVAAAAQGAAPPVALVDDPTPLRELDLATYFSAAMAILFLFFSAQIGTVSLFEERRQGTLARILAGPVQPWTVLLGKLIGGFVMGAVAMATLVLATTLLIGADWGPPIGVALLVLGGILSALGISALVTSFMRTAESAGAASSAVAITLGILGGTFSPTSQAPELLSTIALFTPHGWFLRGLGEIHGAGASVTDALPAIAVLLAIGLVTGSLGMLRARRLVAAR